MQPYTYTRSSTFHVPVSRNEYPIPNPTRPFRFKKEEAKLPEVPQRVFGTEITNLMKPGRPLKRSKNNSITGQGQINLSKAANNSILTNLMGVQDENVKPLNNFISQQDTFRPNVMEEEDSMMGEEGRLVNPQYVEVYVQEIFKYLRDVEDKFSVKSDYMTRNQKDINEKMRAILIDWIVDVHLKFKLRPETLFLTVNLIDRYLEKVNILRSKLQLVGVASMLIACKCEEIYAPEIKDFVYITDKAYTKDEILQTEGHILSVLEFNLTFSSSINFLERYGKLMNLDEKMMVLGRYILELTLVEYKMIKYPQSSLACAVLFLINKITRAAEPWPEVVAKSSKLNESELRQCSKDMLAILQNVEKTNLQAVRKKYALPKFMEISKFVQEKN